MKSIDKWGKENAENKAKQIGRLLYCHILHIYIYIQLYFHLL